MMMKWHALLLIIVLLGSVVAANHFVFRDEAGSAASGNILETVSSTTEGAFVRGSDSFRLKTEPTRNWDVLDPEVSAHAVLIQSLDDYFPFYHFNTYGSWPTASLAKLVTAVVVLEDLPNLKKVEITERAVLTEGIAGGLRAGEIYNTEDLLKILLLSSSNDAATAFEDSNGGRDEFVRLMNKKAREIGMTQTVFYDAAGLSDLNQTNASDVLLLLRYIVKERPQVLNWTRMPTFLVQPVNFYESRLVYNIDPLVSNARFLGGKTGTSGAAKENLASIFSFSDRRVVVIILGSRDRFKETERLLEWVGRAYNL